MAQSYKIAVVPGDGIGPEIISEAQKIAEAAASREGFALEWNLFSLGAKRYLSTGEILPEACLKEMAPCNAMLLGAIGDPAVKPGILERGILLTLRFAFDQYINLRPAKNLPNVPTPVTLNGKKMDSVVVRENTEDLYMGMGGFSTDGTLELPLALKRGGYELSGNLSLKLSGEIPYAAQVALNSKHGVERITRYACELALQRGETHITTVSKSNAAPHLYGFFEDTAREVVKREFPQMTHDVVNVDALCYHLVRRPTDYGVLLCPNLFGDIVSDLQAALAGGMGTAAGGNIGDGLSMFEPVHGSAPDIAGTGKANPIAAILAGGLMLTHLGEHKAAQRVEKAVYSYLEESGISEMPMEFGGAADCSTVGEYILRRI